MVEVIFNFQQNITIIQANINDSFYTIIKKFINKTQLNINNLYFLSNGKYLNKNEIIKNIINESEKRDKKMIILVYSLNSTIRNTNISKSNDIICPYCKEICKYDIKDFKIKLYDCKYRHTKDNIKLDEFVNSQDIDMSKIQCDKCQNKSKFDTFNNEFYIC